MNIKYNTQEAPLRLSTYGRLVQRMVDHVLTIDNREQRQAYAERIVRVMALALKKEKQEKQDKRDKQDRQAAAADVQVKLWNHLALLADYKLDIDYPCDIIQHSSADRPKRIPYPQHAIRLRTYGHLVERALREMAGIDDEDRRQHRLQLITQRMKRNLTANNKGGMTNIDERVAHDLQRYSE